MHWFSHFCKASFWPTLVKVIVLKHKPKHNTKQNKAGLDIFPEECGEDDKKKRHSLSVRIGDGLIGET